VGRATPSHQERGLGPCPEKNRIFHLKWGVSLHSERYFYPCHRHKNVNFLARSNDLVDVKDVLLGSSEYAVRVLGLVSFLLY